MAKSKKISLAELRNPPAIEVVFDICLSEQENLSAQDFIISEKKFSSRFSKKDEIRFFENTIKEEQFSSRHGIHGIAYKNENGKELTQFRLDGFSYHSLKDYPLWPNFLDNALYTWKKYKKCRTELKPIRLGLRYINLIKIPKSCDNVSDYFEVGISLPQKGVGNIKQYQYRYASDFTKNNCSSVVNFVQQPFSKTDEHKSFILDIDIHMKELPENPNDDTLKSYFEEMRKIKNEVFESHLTNNALRIFQ
jgi:uncharacterized protein (TIGR04255 family)